MKKILFLALLCATMPFVSCDDNDGFDPEKPKPVVAVKAVTIDESTISVIAGVTKQLTATVAPENATKKTLTWISSDPTVAAVTSDGVVTGVKYGEAMITATSDENLEIKATCLVTVGKTPVTSVTLNKPTMQIEVGKNETLIATIAPENATVKTVTWSSSATATASVSASGVVTAKEPGTAIITVKTKDGAKTATCTVTVKDVPAVLTPEKTTVALANGGGPLSVSVTSNKGFTAVSNQAWLTVGVTANSVTLTPAVNIGKPDRTATVTLTSKGDTNVKATITVNQKKAAYADYAGNWTLTGVEAGAPITYDLAIAQATAGSTYNATGWGKSVVAVDSKYALVANYDAETGLIFIAAQENIAVYTDTDNIQHDVMFYGQTEDAGKIYYVPGKGYICYMGALLSDGSVQWIDGEVEYTDGSKDVVVGAKYMIKSKADSKMRAFNVDTPFMRKPTMTKKSGASAPAYSPVWRGAAAYEISSETAAIKIVR